MPAFKINVDTSTVREKNQTIAAKTKQANYLKMINISTAFKQVETK